MSLYDEDYYIGEVNKGAYSVFQMPMIRAKCSLYGWNKLRSAIDATCGISSKKAGNGSGGGRSFSRETVQVGRYIVGKDRFDWLILGKDMVTEDDLGEDQRRMADDLENRGFGDVKLLANEHGIGIISKKYGRSLGVYRKPFPRTSSMIGKNNIWQRIPHDEWDEHDIYLVHNWGLRNFTAAIEDEWRNLSINDNVDTTKEMIGGRCYAEVYVDGFDNVIKLLSEKI